MNQRYCKRNVHRLNVKENSKVQAQARTVLFSEEHSIAF